jgi:uncharacterized protein YndB with AHSA1/START domain
MSDEQFTYQIYIDSSPKRLWHALTDPGKTKKWWNVVFITDWKPGSVMVVKQSGVTIKDPEQVVLEATPHSRLSYTWHTFSPEWATVHGFSEATRQQFASESRSKVTFDIGKAEGVVRLTVTHDGFDEGSAVLAAIRDGWPPIISSLKTYLETGEPLDFTQ